MLMNRGKGILFTDFTTILEAFGFYLDRINGSHYIYIHKSIKQLISVQSDGKEAKPYQIKQFIAIVERFNLKMEE